MTENPLLKEWNTPFDAPPFSEIAPEHFRPAFDAALAEHDAEIAAIADERQRADLRQHHRCARDERRGRCGASPRSSSISPARTPTMRSRTIERDMAPVLAKHRSAIYQNEALFRRVDSAEGARGDARPFGRAGPRARPLASRLRPPGRGARRRRRSALAEITERLAVLGTQFGQNVLADERAYTLVLEGEADLAGLSDCAARSGGEGGGRARHGRQARHHAVALLDRAVPAILHPPRPARGGVQGVDRARRERRRDRQPRRSSPRWWGSGPSAPSCSATKLRAFPARRHDGEDAGSGARPAELRLDAGARQGAARERRAAGA